MMNIMTNHKILGLSSLFLQGKNLGLSGFGVQFSGAGMDRLIT